MKNGWLLYPLGIALSGKQRTPGGGTDLAAMLGREETLGRLRAALAALSGGDVDLVILDIMMPFVDGMTCLKEMRSRKITTPKTEKVRAPCRNAAARSPFYPLLSVP